MWGFKERIYYSIIYFLINPRNVNIMIIFGPKSNQGIKSMNTGSWLFYEFDALFGVLFKPDR